MKIVHTLLLTIRATWASKGLFIWRWAGSVKRAGSPRWDKFLSHVHMESSISVQSKSLLCRWKKIIWSSIFYNKVTWSHYAEQMFLYYLINIWKVKQNWLKKMLSHLAGLAHCVCSYGNFSSHLRGIPAKSSEIAPRRLGSLLIRTYYTFIRIS